jgi:hypothetical protein
LIQRVKNVAGRRADQQPADGVRGQLVAIGSQKAVRAIAVKEFFARVRGGDAVKDFAGVDAYAGEISSQAVGGVEGDRHLDIVAGNGNR